MKTVLSPGLSVLCMITFSFFTMSPSCQKDKPVYKADGTMVGLALPGKTAQTWEITFPEPAAGINQIAKVQVTPFTASGTFSETSDSPGIWIRDASGDNCYRLPVGGNIVHDTPGDRWSFVAMSGGGCGMSTIGSNSSGTANGNFPNASRITNGVVTITTTTPIGTVSDVVYWTAVRIN